MPHIEPYHNYRPDPADSADRHLPQELLQAENERLHREVTTLRAALKAAGRVLGPYIDPQKGPRR